MNLEIVISFVFASMSLALAPGPDNMYVLTQSMIHGKKYGLATVYGLISGCIIHTSLLAFGVSMVIKNNEKLFFLLKLFGAIYLLYLAYKVYKSNHHISLSSNSVVKKTTKELFFQGFTMNVLNPKVSIFFLAFFPAFLFSKTINTVVQFYVLGGIFMLVSLVIFSLIAILAGKISFLLQKSSDIGLYFKWIQIVVFVGIALFILI